MLFSQNKNANLTVCRSALSISPWTGLVAFYSQASFSEPQRSRVTSKLTPAALSAAAVCILIMLAALWAPPASAMFFGNYALNIEGRRDFHTYILSMIAPCRNPDNSKRQDCVDVRVIPQPVAKAIQGNGQAWLAEGKYTLILDDYFGLRCGDIYYGPTIPTHDVYTWDATTLAGQMVSSFDSGCDGAPGGSLTYPISFTRM